MKTIILKTPEVAVKAYGMAEYQIRDEQNIQIGTLSTEYLFSSGKYPGAGNPTDALKELETHVKKIGVVDELLEAAISVVEKCNVMPNSKCNEGENPLGILVQAIKKATNS